MKLVKLKVTGQHLDKIGNYKLIRDSKNYIKLDFSFLTKDWNNCIKTVVFKTADGKTGSKIMTDNVVKVPVACSASESFTVSVFGVNHETDKRITTNPIEIVLGASGYAEAGEFNKPLPSVYEQILDTCKNAVEVAEDVKKRADAGEFNGKNGIDGKNGVDGKDGNDYVLTDADKAEIAGMVKPKLQMEEAVIDYTEAFIHTDITNCITVETSLLPNNARVKKVEIPDVVNGTDEYIQLEDMAAKDPMGMTAPYFIMYPKNTQGNYLTLAASVVFPFFTNGFFDAVGGLAFVDKTIKIYYEIEV